jgi:hypothetical protein
MDNITDEELEQLEKEFQEKLNAKPKAKKEYIPIKKEYIPIEKLDEELEKDLQKANKTDNKIKNHLKKTKYNKSLIGKLEKHLEKDDPEIEFYDKIIYRGNNVIALNFKSKKYGKSKYSRKNIQDIGNDISQFLHEEGVHGNITNAMSYPETWRSGYFTEIGQDVILFDMNIYDETIKYEEPKDYKAFQFYLILKDKPEGGNDKFNDCLFNCLHSYLYSRLPWKTPTEFKKYLKLKREDKVPIQCIKKIEDKLKTYAINIRGDYIYSSTVKKIK